MGSSIQLIVMKTVLFTIASFIALAAPLLSAQEFQLSTHVLDTSLGKPGQGVRVILDKKDASGKWIEIEKGITDQDGRIRTFLKLDEKRSNEGVYRFTFLLDEYFKKRGEDTVFPEGVVVFNVVGDAHYHIPLVVTPHAISTYRGS